MHEFRQLALQKFIDWCARHITGDEKGEAQTFLDRLFQAFGREGAREVGGTFEERIKKSKEDGGGTSFADYVWKPVVLIEMKKRGVDLSKHFRQARDYWIELAPGRPKYVILCNFDEFWIYDLDTQPREPKDILRLSELATRPDPLAFLFPTNETPVFGNDKENVTREAADLLAECFGKLVVRGVDRDLAQRFILQSLVALFAEDIGLLDRNTVTRLIDRMEKPEDAYDEFGGLFTEMNTPGVTPGGNFKGVRYFNGGIFAQPARIPELYPDELKQLAAAASKNWSNVSPEIFGELFQKSMNAESRHAFGAHFTYPSDILKIVKPTIVDPWTDAIESAKSGKKLLDLLERLTTLRVLDPACGSGNFLFLAYWEMKNLEARIRERLTTEFPDIQPRLIHVNARQFFGLDVNKFAVELAKVTMMIARKLAIDKFHISDEAALPLDNLDANFQARDALIDELGNVAPWPAADVIIGNPPFLGAKLLKPKRGVEYVKKLRKAYAVVPGMADYCVYWIRRAQDALPECTKTDPFAGRAGLVGTQNVRNNQSRVGGLDYVAAGGTIIDAVDNQPWSGEANVNVAISNWVKSKDKALLPAKRRLWFKAADVAGPKVRRKRGDPKAFQLDFRDTSHISSGLSDQTDVSSAVPLRCNTEPQVCFNGQFPRCHDFVISPDEARRLLAEDSRNNEVVHPFLIGSEFLTQGRPRRFVIDFQKRDILEAQTYRAPFDLVQKDVLPYVAQYAETERNETGKNTGQDQNWLETWWQHFRCRKEMVDRVEALTRYIVCSDTTLRPVFAFVHPSIRPDHKLRVFAFDDDYSFGMLQSHPHWLWFVTKCSKLTARFNYTSSSVFDPFPWPQSPTRAQVDAVAIAGREVRRVRADALAKVKGGLRAVYRTLELPGKNPLKDAHAALDAAVLKAYAFDPRADLLAQLLDLNGQVAAREKTGEAVTPPGVPAGYGEAGKLVSEDCIRP